MVTISNLFVDAGSTYSTIITVKSSAGQAIDLTGYSVESQIRKWYSSSVSYNFNASIYNASEGKISLDLSATQSSSIPSGRWLYDVEITAANGIKTRVVEGVVTITPEITKQGFSTTPNNNINSISDIDDIDIITYGKLDGSVLVYKSATNKWTSTKILDSQYMDGGEF